MDMLRVGRSLRALRIRRGLRQLDVAQQAGVSRSQVARIERGETARLPLGDVAVIAAALGADLEIRVRWHGEGLDRLLDATHAGLVDQTVRILKRAGWQTAVEVSFGVGGERGSIDVLGFHDSTATILVVEVKSVIPDAQAMLASHDRKARLAPTIGAGLGWRVAQVGRLLMVKEGTTSRRRVGHMAALFDAAYPQRAVEVRRWLRQPGGKLAGLMFLPYDREQTLGQGTAGRQRVQRPRRPRFPAR